MVNKVFLIGNVGNDPECIYLESGGQIAKLSLATNESYKNKKGEKVQNTQWHNIVAYGKTAELIEKYVEKGQRLGVFGSINYREWDDKDGNKRYTTEIKTSEVTFFSSESRQDKPQSRKPAAEQSEEEDTDDLPF